MPALPLVLERMPTTLLLTLAAMGLALAVALPVGIYSAIRRNSTLDHVATAVVFLGQSMPVFRTGIMLILLFAVQWRLLPVSGWESSGAVVLPAHARDVLGPAPLADRPIEHAGSHQSRLRAHRARQGRVGVTNAALPLVTVMGLQFGALLGGAVITESVFAVPGVGRLIVDGIRQLDFPVVQAAVFMLAMIVVFVNFAVDMLYIYLNPQIRIR